MAQAAVLEALGNDLILERIFQPHDFKRLKELRLVCKSWNAFACRRLRSRCKNIHLHEHDQLKAFDKRITDFSLDFTRKVQQVDVICNHWNWILIGKLCDCCSKSQVRSAVQLQKTQLANPQVFLNLPIELEIRAKCIRMWFRKELLFRLVEATWRSQVVSLTMSLWFTVAEVNCLTLFLLHHLTGLKKLEYCYIENQSGPREGYEDYHCQVPVPEVDLDSKFGLEYLQFGIVEGGFQAHVPDPGFLRYCRELKTFKIKCHLHSNPNIGNDTCLNFLNRWNQMVLAESGAFPRIRHLQFEIWSRFKTMPVIHVHICKSILDLINLNEPTRLDLLGNFDYYFPNLFSKIQCWTPGIQALAIDVPDIKRGNLNFRDFFELLKKFSVFANLTHVSLRPSNFEAQSKLQLNGSKDEHQLSKVVSVSLDFGIQKQMLQSLRQTAIQFPSLTQLNIKLPHEVYGERDIDLDLFFDSCKNFSALRLLSLDVEYCRQGSRCQTIKIDYSPMFQGPLKRLQVLKNLKMFKLIVYAWDAEMQDMLVALFQGYQPHVSLDLEVCTRKRYGYLYGSWYNQVVNRQKLILSVEGFKEALEKAYKAKLDDCNIQVAQ